MLTPELVGRQHPSAGPGRAAACARRGGDLVAGLPGGVGRERADESVVQRRDRRHLRGADADGDCKSSCVLRSIHLIRHHPRQSDALDGRQHRGFRRIDARWAAYPVPLWSERSPLSNFHDLHHSIPCFCHRAYAQIRTRFICAGTTCSQPSESGDQRAPPKHDSRHGTGC
jgi:hypothetical protein